VGEGFGERVLIFVCVSGARFFCAHSSPNVGMYIKHPLPTPQIKEFEKPTYAILVYPLFEMFFSYFMKQQLEFCFYISNWNCIRANIVSTANAGCLLLF
jgi:hypothetical protein